MVFGILTALVFAGVTATVTEQFPGFRATSLLPDTLQIFFDAFATVNLIFAFGVTVMPIWVANAAPAVFCFTFEVGCAAGAGAAAGVETVPEDEFAPVSTEVDGLFI